MAKRLLLTALFVALAMAITPMRGIAQQPEPELVLGFEAESKIGKGLAVAAYLVDPAGNPIQGEVVTFSIDAKFMNTLGRVKIGEATTDETGLALLLYMPRLSGERTIKAQFLGNDVFAATDTLKPILVAEGPEVFSEEIPFRIPGANIGVVIGVLIVIWALYLLIVGLFWRISRAGDSQGVESGAQP